MFLPKNESIIKPTEDDDEYVDDNDDADWIIMDQLPNSGPYAFKGFQWICYDDVKIVAKKAEYVVEKSLGGIIGKCRYIFEYFICQCLNFMYRRNHVLGDRQ